MVSPEKLKIYDVHSFIFKGAVRLRELPSYSGVRFFTGGALVGRVPSA